MSTAPAKARFDLPTIEDESRPFWDALKAGQLLIGHCKACGKTHYYPRPFCPSCWSKGVALVTASGRGTLYSYSTVFMNDLPPFNERLPYIAAMVDLDEGVRVSTNMVECKPEDLKVGMAVTVMFKAVSPDVTIPVFRPA